MDYLREIRKHPRIQAQIVSACKAHGIHAIQEYRGQGWRADVFIPNNGQPIAFEIQLSPQSLSKTLERQAKYNRDGIIGCWFFENPVSKLNEERPDLPLFYVEDGKDLELWVNLGDRRKIDLSEYLLSFISNNIQFRTVANTNSSQTVNINFYEMACWKCGEMNHLFYVESPFNSACNAKIKPEEALWNSTKVEYNPEIVELAFKFVTSRQDLNLKLGQIKERFSNTVNASYMSFGCYRCDSIFGDYYVFEAKLDSLYGTYAISHQEVIQLRKVYSLDIPHWCYPINKQFCSG